MGVGSGTVYAHPSPCPPLSFPVEKRVLLIQHSPKGFIPVTPQGLPEGPHFRFKLAEAELLDKVAIGGFMAPRDHHQVRG